MPKGSKFRVGPLGNSAAPQCRAPPKMPCAFRVIKHGFGNGQVPACRYHEWVQVARTRGGPGCHFHLPGSSLDSQRAGKRLSPGGSARERQPGQRVPRWARGLRTWREFHGFENVTARAKVPGRPRASPGRCARVGERSIDIKKIR